MSELEDLVELLRAKTSKGKIPWTAQGNLGWMPNADIRLQTVQGDNYVGIFAEGDSDAGAIALTVRNRDGIVLAQGVFEAGTKSFNRLEEIISTVKRQSLGVESALSDLRSRLEAL